VALRHHNTRVLFSFILLGSLFFMVDFNTIAMYDIFQNNAEQTADVFTFYYPWYGTPMFSGNWFHWDNTEYPIHDPNNITNGQRDIAAVHYPLIDVYDSNDENVIRLHISMAKAALIDGFVASWWGIGSFEDQALSHIRRMCEEQNFLFSIYYEDTSSASNALNDFLYLLTTYADSDSWYRINDRPVFYIYGRAREQLGYSGDWTIDGHPNFWRLFEIDRDPPRTGIMVFHPFVDSPGYIRSDWIGLEEGDSFSLKVGLANFQNDCDPISDVGFRVLSRGDHASWIILKDQIVNFNDGWFDWSFNISSLAGQDVQVRVESYSGGASPWCGEWACADYIRIEDSQGQILNPGSDFDSGWKTVVDSLATMGYNPFFIMDFGGYETQIENFANYIFSFMDGIHTYIPIGMDFSVLGEVYSRASTVALSQNKLFVATVVPGYDDTGVRDPGYIVEREYGDYYRSMWATSKACNPGGFIITSFNEWHEGSEIEPSVEYLNHYLDITFQELGGIFPSIPEIILRMASILVLSVIVITLVLFIIFVRSRKSKE
jgi:hypothetical protein